MRHARLVAGVTRLVLQEAGRDKRPLTRAQMLDVFAGDIELIAQGLAIWLDTQRRRPYGVRRAGNRAIAAS